MTDLGCAFYTPLKCMAPEPDEGEERTDEHCNPRCAHVGRWQTPEQRARAAHQHGSIKPETDTPRPTEAPPAQTPQAVKPTLEDRQRAREFVALVDRYRDAVDGGVITENTLTGMLADWRAAACKEGRKTMREEAAILAGSQASRKTAAWLIRMLSLDPPPTVLVTDGELAAKREAMDPDRFKREYLGEFPPEPTWCKTCAGPSVAAGRCEGCRGGNLWAAK